MNYYANWIDCEGEERQARGEELTELAEEISSLLSPEDGTVKIYDVVGFCRGWVRAGEWSLK